MMRYGLSVKATNVLAYSGGAFHTFYQPVEANTKGELNIFTFCDDADVSSDLKEYYQLNVMGYVYDKLNIISLTS